MQQLSEMKKSKNFDIPKGVEFHGFWIFRVFLKFGFQTLLLGTIFCGFHVQYLKVTKTGSHMVISLFNSNLDSLLVFAELI